MKDNGFSMRSSFSLGILLKFSRNINFLWRFVLISVRINEVSKSCHRGQQVKERSELKIKIKRKLLTMFAAGNLKFSWFTVCFCLPSYNVARLNWYVITSKTRQLTFSGYIVNAINNSELQFLISEFPGALQQTLKKT